MASNAYRLANHAYIRVVMALAEPRHPDHRSDLIDLIEKILLVTDVWAGVLEEERAAPGVGEVFATEAFGKMVECAGLLASQQWPIPADCSDRARPLYWPSIFALLVARADACHREL